MKNLLSVLTSPVNLDKWMIFNGSVNIINQESVKIKKCDWHTHLYTISKGHGLSTNFMIYNHRAYDDLLSYDITTHIPIDVFIAEKFKQHTAIYEEKYIAHQRESYSDIANKMKDYQILHKTSSDFIISHIHNT